MNLAEGVQSISLIVLGGLMLISALGVVALNNIVYSAFLLAGVFLSMAGLYILLNADFIAAAQILIYVGAINVLILFAIMLVNKREDFKTMPNQWVRNVATAFVCIGLFALLGTMIFITPWAVDTTSSFPENTIVAIGQHFFSDYLLPFELASVLLLMAMVGAIILARRDLIPDAVPKETRQDTILTLPERPRDV